MKVIKIGAVWCPGCIIMKPRWEQIEDELPWLETVYYDYDEDADKVEPLNVGGEKLPVFIFLNKKGTEITRKHGEIPKDELIEFCKRHKDE